MTAMYLRLCKYSALSTRRVGSYFLAQFCLDFLAFIHHQADQAFHLALRNGRIHTGEFEALAIVHTRVADDGGASIEQARIS